MGRNLIAEVSTSLNISEFEWIEGDFAEVAMSIEDLIIEFREIGVDLPWKKLLNKKVNYEIYTFTDLIDYVDGIEIDQERFDYGMGQSGFHYEFFYEKDKLFQKSLNCLNELKISILNILNEDKNQLKKLIKENNDLKETNKKIKILQNEIKQFKIELKESKNKTDSNKKLNDSLIEVIQFFSNEKKKFLVIDSLLFDKNGNLFSIVNSKIKVRVAIDLLNLFHFLNIVEVVESSLDGSVLGNIPSFAMGTYNSSRGWGQSKTLLKAEGFDIMKIREEYINNK
jgi:hypothetical protein|tara:strand:- start:670 stop:1518 length:849 start_codon:yes stop_codon:yes gene_type:complete